VAVSRRQPRLVLRAACWLPVIACLAALGMWAAMAVARVGSDLALGVWSGELARANDSGPGNYLKDRLTLIVGVLAAFFPGSLLCLSAWFGRRRSTPDASTAAPATEGEAPVLRFLAVALVVSLGFFVLQPGVRPRFCYPALPWCALLGGHLLVRALATPGLVHRAVRCLAAVVTLIAVVLVVLGLALHAMPIADLEPFDSLGHLLVSVLAVAVVWTLSQLRKPVTSALLIGPLVILIGARLVQTTQFVPQENAQRPKQTFGAELDALVPEGDVIDLRFWGGFNELSYTARRLVFSEPPEPIGGQRFVLALASQIAMLRASTDRELVEVAELRLIKGTEVRLLEVR